MFILCEQVCSEKRTCVVQGSQTAEPQGAGPLSISKIREEGLVDCSKLGSLCPIS